MQLQRTVVGSCVEMERFVTGLLGRRDALRRGGGRLSRRDFEVVYIGAAMLVHLQMNARSVFDEADGVVMKA
jgi:hypothetical protein